MIGSKRVLAIIPARGGSKGLPGKNIQLVHDRPLLAWTVDAALASSAIDRAVLSSDDDAIMAIARGLGCDVPFRRPDSLATDTATSLDVALHALDQLPGFDVIVLLQPTSPLRTAADIDAACGLLAASRATSCVSVAPVEQSPYWMYTLRDDLTLDPLLTLPEAVTRRQDLPPVFALNGAVYVAEVSALRRHRTFITPQTVAYVMPIERSIDIDTRADLDVFCTMVSQESHA